PRRRVTVRCNCLSGGGSHDLMPCHRRLQSKLAAPISHACPETGNAVERPRAQCNEEPGCHARYHEPVPRDLDSLSEPNPTSNSYREWAYYAPKNVHA